MFDLIKELFRFRRFKPSQGVLTRRLTAFGVFIIFASGAYRFFITSPSLPFVSGSPEVARIATGIVAIAIILAGAWFAFRLVNWSTFANFLVSVEGEMEKVSWPSREELYSSTVVVLVFFVILAGMILFFDLAWMTIFKIIRVIP
ncbi:MAG: preprotein translocase subunit SecE [Planctomycetaceae bacterium]|jgi:preprotein translocase subunit SecE|nr:preprotein translocase subunit SecE [Planctomycetaceae bacterium]